MNCDSCIEQMNKIDWGVSKLEIYDELKYIIRNYDKHDTSYWEILLGLYTPALVDSVIYDRLKYFGIGAVIKLLERLDPDDPGTLFKLSDDDRFVEAVESDLRYRWCRIMSKLQSDRLKDVIEQEEPSSKNNEEDWIEEDDDFLTKEVKQ